METPLIKLQNKDLDAVNNNLNINIKFFGSFRKFGESININIPNGSSVFTAKQLLQKELNDNKLVTDSVLANDTDILQYNDIIDDDAPLSILPPVCGG